MNLGCLLFNATTAMSWHAAQDLCKEFSSHLVEIFTPEQQDFMVMKAFEAHGITGMEREWWIGLTDDNSEGRWYWIDSLKEAKFIPWGVWQPDGGKEANFGSMFAGFDYRWTDETSAFEYGNPMEEKRPTSAQCLQVLIIVGRMRPRHLSIVVEHTPFASSEIYVYYNRRMISILHFMICKQLASAIFLKENKAKIDNRKVFRCHIQTA